MPVSSGDRKAFICFFIVKLKSVGQRRTTELCMRYREPQEEEDFASEILSAFCFPLGPESVLPKEYMASEEYMFALNREGKRFQGFCRKSLPPAPKVGPKLRFPHVLCIISDFPWAGFFFKALQVIESLLKATEGLHSDPSPRELPQHHPLYNMLNALVSQLSPQYIPGQVIRVPLPVLPGQEVSTRPSPSMRRAGSIGDYPWPEDHIDLCVPPDTGNGRWNCGIGLARLLWHVPVESAVTLIASMLLERRIIITGQSRDTVTAVVQAAAALLYPFRWHHIYLPLLPKQLSDYLSAPMPFMVGLPAQMLPVLKQLSMNEVTLLDLDLGTCDPPPGSARDDSLRLPWREQLVAALRVAYGLLKSPTELESSPFIAGVMQAWFLKLIGHYRMYIHADIPATNALYAQAAMPSPRRQGSTPTSSAPNSASKDVRDRGDRDHAAGAGGSRPGSQSKPQRAASVASTDNDDAALRGFGFVFEHEMFVAHHRRTPKAQQFLSMMRHSQLFEVFVQERLKLASENYETESAFEAKVVQHLERVRHQQLQRSSMGSSRMGSQQQAQPQSRWSAMLNKHRRTGSNGTDTLAGPGPASVAAAGGSHKTSPPPPPPGRLDSSFRRITTAPTALDQVPVQAAGWPDPWSLFPEDPEELEGGLGFELPVEHLGSVLTHEQLLAALRARSAEEAQAAVSGVSGLAAGRAVASAAAAAGLGHGPRRSPTTSTDLAPPALPPSAPAQPAPTSSRRRRHSPISSSSSSSSNT